MSEKDKTDDLFRANSDYLSNQPHREFNPEAFWQQLRPELARPARKPAGWWRVSAAVVALVMLAGLGWWVQSEQDRPEKAVALQPARKLPNEDPEATRLPEASVRLENKLAKQPVAAARTSAKREPLPKVETKASERADGPLPSGPAASANETVATTPLADPEQEMSAPATPAAEPVKPRYRIVHLNEIQPQKEQKSQSRPQLALRIGVPGASAPRASESGIPLAVPINN